MSPSSMEIMMAYKRKTYDEYQIHGNYGYGHGFEEVTCETTFREARDMLKCYRDNEPGVPFKIIVKRVHLPH